MGTGPCTDGISTIDAIGTQLRDLIDSGLTRWRLATLMYYRTVAESGRKEKEPWQKAPDSEIRPWVLRMIRPTLDGTVKPTNSQARTGTGKNIFPCSADHKEDSKPYLIGALSAQCAAGQVNYSHLKRFDIFTPLTGGRCSEGLDALRFFSKPWVKNHIHAFMPETPYFCAAVEDIIPTNVPNHVKAGTCSSLL